MKEESTVVNFIFMAFVLFCLLKAINKLTSIGHKAEEPKAEEKPAEAPAAQPATEPQQ